MNLPQEDFLQKQLEKLESFNGNSSNQEAKKPEQTLASKLDSDKSVKNNTTELVENKEKESTVSNEEVIDVKNISDDKVKIDLDKNKSEENKKDNKVNLEKIDKQDKDYLDWLNGEDSNVKSESESKEKKEKEDSEDVIQYKNKIKEYEDLLSDSYVKAIIDFRKEGGTDLSDLNKKLGVVDVDKLTINDFYKNEALEAGLTGQEAIDAVDEALERYKELPKIEQLKKLNSYKNAEKNKVASKIDEFVARNESLRQMEIKVRDNSLNELKTIVNDMVGKKFRGLLITEDMSKDILNEAPLYSLPSINDKGFIDGYDVKKGVELAIYAKFSKKLLKAQHELAKISSYEEIIETRNRPSENITSNQIVTSAPNDIEKLTKDMRDEAKRKKSRIGV